MKNITNNDVRQQISILDPEPLSDLKTQPVKFFLSQSRHFCKLYNQLIRMADLYNYVFPSVDHLAYKVGIGSRTVQKFTRLMKEYGLLSVYYRTDNTNYYRLPTMFTDLRLRSLLSGILPACKWIPLIFLSVTKPLLPQFTAYNLEKGTLSINIKSSSSTGYIYKPEPVKKRRLDFEERLRNFKKERVMKHFEQSDVDTMLKSFTNVLPFISLTPVGMKELLAFPSQAIDYALTEFKRTNANNIRDHFKYFYKLCQNYCENTGIRPDYGYTKKLDLPKDAPRYEQLSGNDENKDKSSIKGNTRAISSTDKRNQAGYRDERYHWTPEQKQSEYDTFVDMIKKDPTLLSPKALEFFNVLEQNGTSIKESIENLVDKASKLNGGEQKRIM